ncbi:GntR family transcriptional regulator [Moraxella bovoculi]|uniref:GntR family transcriptional regulator n=1 Tax=Moraxella bovoculi TaxID=386891 RepID=A0AAC8T7T5_9GAMM|nr:UTRA domain-containing protein [Moraxella bovoculi]AKG07367.1 GntR family transcriptional regulator [Moraxella bovoculi]AKG10028.1 GntR family transcriptional regulator [Moraxella bovoculi]AKG11950.1 GntR family transcriptional regulator [Moraxella bovoculi]AKG13917.1 GntR family transcriptional regulator [Moraxella bovoculi]
MTAKTPAYLRIKQDILTRIHAGEWVVGSAIPTEMVLTKEFGVARMTVNRALKELTDERVLERRQGSGTFVAQQKFNRAYVNIRNIAHDIEQQGKRYTAKVLSKSIICHADIESHLRSALLNEFALMSDGLDGDQPAIFEVKILHFADDTPVQYEERWVNAELLPEFIEQDFSQVNTSEFLIANLPLEYGSYTISAVNADDQVAAALQIQSHDAVLLLGRKTHSRGQIATVAQLWHAGDQHQFSGML